MQKQQTSNEYGISQELLALSLLVNYGPVSVPYGNSARYDCILDCNKKFYRIQIKSLNLLDKDTILIPMCNTRFSRKDGVVDKTYTTEQTDFIAIVYENQIYLFNPNEANKAFTVRINKPTQSNQHWLKDYEITKVLGINLNSWTSLKEQNRINNGTNTQKRFNCIDCGKPVWQENSRCVECAKKVQQSNSKKPSREVLKEKIRNTPFVQIGKEYGVTDNAVRKWCKSYDLPSTVSKIKEIIQKGEWDFV